MLNAQVRVSWDEGQGLGIIWSLVSGSVLRVRSLRVEGLELRVYGLGLRV